MHFTTSSIVPPMKSHTMYVWGWKDDPVAAATSVNAMKDAVMKLNTHLNGKSWLVGGRLTLADIVVFNSLLTPFTFIFDAGFRKAMPHVCNWFEKMNKLPFVARTAGIIRPMGTVKHVKAPAATAAKQQKTAKSKAAPKEAKKEEADEEFDVFGESDEES